MIDEKIEKKIQKIGERITTGDNRIYHIPSGWVRIIYPDRTQYKLFVTDITISHKEIHLENENLRVATIPRSNIQMIRISSDYKELSKYEIDKLKKIYMRDFFFGDRDED